MGADSVRGCDWVVGWWALDSVRGCGGAAFPAWASRRSPPHRISGECRNPGRRARGATGDLARRAEAGTPLGLGIRRGCGRVGGRLARTLSGDAVGWEVGGPGLCPEMRRCCILGVGVTPMTTSPNFRRKPESRAAGRGATGDLARRAEARTPLDPGIRRGCGGREADWRGLCPGMRRHRISGVGITPITTSPNFRRKPESRAAGRGATGDLAQRAESGTSVDPGFRRGCG